MIILHHKNIIIERTNDDENKDNTKRRKEYDINSSKPYLRQRVQISHGRRTHSQDFTLSIIEEGSAERRDASP